MPDLRAEARGKPCQVRVPGVCNFDPETTVLAHLRRGGVTGLGQKPVDLCGVWACSACHDLIDGRTKRPDHVSREQLDSWILDALCRTLTLRERREEEP